MIIDVQFDSTTAGAPAGFFTAVNAAVEFWERELINPLTVTIVFGYNSVNGSVIGSSALAESVSNGINVNYANLKMALTSAATSANDTISVAHLPGSDPTGGAGFFVTLAEAEVLGQFSTANTTVGWAGISSAFPFTFDPTNRSVGGDYDAVGAMEHEVSEILGRIAGSGTLQNMVAQFSPLDLFRYVSAGHLALTPEAASFSIDGTHLLFGFNDPTTGNDAGDWDGSVNGDSFGFGVQGVAGLVSPTDLELMDVLGYKLAPDPTAKNDFNADGKSGFVVENTSGMVQVGEVVNGQAAYTVETSLTSVWKFVGDGDFLGAGSDQYLLYNTHSGAVDATEVINHQTVMTQVGGRGAQWSFVGVGDYLGLADGDQFLVQNTSGVVQVVNAESGTAVYTTIANQGLQWKFVGSGDYFAEGRDQFLLYNTSNDQVIAGQTVNGHTSYTFIANQGPQWKFVGSGDYLADGRDQFLLYNTNNDQVVVGEVANGHTSYTFFANQGPQWKFVGTGDYFADGHNSFLIENTNNGSVMVGDWFNNTIHYTQVSSLASQWTFH